ncbi:MAG: M20/M25/M40 family metallo-hydrolase [Tatlockia sp.]|nr:M20/M25/M40 family metallo-hydrolase [Tatlockia sp.]
MHFLWTISLITGIILTNPLFAQSEQLQVPQCLATHLAIQHKILAENKAFKIIDIPLTEMDNLVLQADEMGCGYFINLSQYFAGTSFSAQRQLAQTLLAKTRKKKLTSVTLNYKVQHQEQVEAALKIVNSAKVWQTLDHLTSYYNRSATETTGLQTAEWLKAQFENLVLASGRQDSRAYFVKTRAPYQQPSLVTVIGKDLKTPAIVIGAHMDTLSGLMPGAGDNASGSATILEAARILLGSKMTLKRPIYIIWYAAEERGLVGSQAVVVDFLTNNIPVKAVMQLDMAGHRHDDNDPTLWLYRDVTDKTLNHFVAELINTYLKVPVAYSQCGYACSDHASWAAKGFSTTFPVETSFAEHNPYIHSSTDTLSLLNTEHLMNFTKLALAFAMELALSE